MRILEQNSFFQLRKSFTLSSSDEEVLSFLYLPILNSDAYSLYHNLYQYCMLDTQLGGFLHDQFLTALGLSDSDFLLARMKLEAIGLLEVYRKEEKDVSMQIKASYLYILLPPASPKKFFNDILLRALLNDSIGNKKYDFFYHYFQVEEKSFSKGYVKITTPFKDVFAPVVNEGDSSLNNVSILLEDKNYKKQSNFDKSTFETLLKEIQYPLSQIKPYYKEIEDLCTLYDPSLSDVVNLISQNTNSTGTFYFDSFKQDVRNLRQFEIEKKDEDIQDDFGNGEYAKIIKQFNSVTPDDFLAIRYNAKPAPFMLKEIESLKQNLGFSNSIINVILDYSYRKCKGEFNTTFIDKVAYTLSSKNVKNAYEAMMELTKRDFEIKQVTRKKKISEDASSKETKEEEDESASSLEDFVL